jgi:hypothetical protein
MIEITVDSFVDGTEAILEEFGENHVYEMRDSEHGLSCVYVYQGEPDCIVGKFLANAGVSLDLLKEADNNTFGGGISAYGLLGNLVDRGVITIEGDAFTALCRLQGSQDEGTPWGEAVHEAMEAIRGA